MDRFNSTGNVPNGKSVGKPPPVSEDIVEDLGEMMEERLKKIFE